MIIQLLTRKQYQERTGLDRVTIWRKVKRGEITVLKVAAKKLWFLPPRYEVKHNY